jgi:cyclophilin family peptidyl-prolyl cis-trans isomerase
MKLLPCLVLTTALLVAHTVQAQLNQPPPPPKSKTEAQSSSNPLKSIKKKEQDESKPSKPTKEQLNETHTLAIMEVEFGGAEHQIIFELLGDKAPKTVQNFIDNVDKGVYKGLAFHRAVDNYLVQTGDPASRDDAARESWGLSQESTIPGEFSLPHVSGSVAMARRGDKVNPSRRSDGTQFYFALGNMSNLNGQYSVFGQVVSGLEDLRAMSQTVTDTNDCPLERIEIKSIKIAEQKGPLITMSSAGGSKTSRITKPEAAKGALEKVLERIW